MDPHISTPDGFPILLNKEEPPAYLPEPVRYLFRTQFLKKPPEIFHPSDKESNYAQAQTRPKNC